jgi:hypothetical protein
MFRSPVESDDLPVDVVVPEDHHVKAYWRGLVLRKQDNRVWVYA